MLGLIGTPRIPLVVFVLLAACVALLPGRACAEDVAVSTQAALLLKVLAMDRRHLAETDAPFVAGVLYDSRVEESQRQSSSFVAAMAADARVHGRRVVVHRFDFAEEGKSLQEFLKTNHISLAWVSVGIDAQLERILARTREAAVTSAAATPALVEQGVTVGVESVEGKPQIVINLESAKAESCEFMASLLKLARVVKAAPPAAPEKSAKTPVPAP